jgi:hypothetical protein
MCHAQTFVHVVVYSVQMLSFPVIGVERYFSIRHPLERQAHLRRVNGLIGQLRRRRLDEHLIHFFAVATWCFSLALGSLSMALLPTTTVSIYCNATALSQEKMHELFLKIYVITFPLGVVCLSVTGTPTSPRRVPPLKAHVPLGSDGVYAHRDRCASPRQALAGHAQGRAASAKKASVAVGPAGQIGHRVRLLDRRHHGGRVVDRA